MFNHAENIFWGTHHPKHPFPLVPGIDPSPAFLLQTLVFSYCLFVERKHPLKLSGGIHYLLGTFCTQCPRFYCLHLLDKFPNCSLPAWNQVFAIYHLVCTNCWGTLSHNIVLRLFVNSPEIQGSNYQMQAGFSLDRGLRLLLVTHLDLKSVSGEKGRRCGKGLILELF